MYYQNKGVSSKASYLFYMLNESPAFISFLFFLRGEIFFSNLCADEPLPLGTFQSIEIHQGTRSLVYLEQLIGEKTLWTSRLK